MNEPVKEFPSIPYAIDGTTVFKVKTKNRLELRDSLKDGRKWKNDSRKELSGLNVCLIQRLFGDNTCPNNNCLFYKQFKYGNCTNFQIDGTCKCCSAFENCTACLAWKATAFNNYKEATVYHCGHHYCVAKEISKCSRHIVRNTSTRDWSTAPQTIQSTRIIADLRSRKNWQKVEKSAKRTENVSALSKENVKRKKVL